jgi:hypothetical protein
MTTLALLAVLFAAQPPMGGAAVRAKAALVARHGEVARARIERGVDQVAAQWRKKRRGRGGVREFFEEQFVADPAQLESAAGSARVRARADGRALPEINRELARWTVLDLGPMIELDKLLGAYDAGAPQVGGPVPVEGRLRGAGELSRSSRWPRRWSRGRAGRGGSGPRRGLARRFDRRMPAEVLQGRARPRRTPSCTSPSTTSGCTTSWARTGPARSPGGLKLISHWNLRDELKSQYANRTASSASG